MCPSHLRMFTNKRSVVIPGLNVSSLEAMKVSNSYKLVNDNVIAALRFMSAKTGLKELLITAFYRNNLALVQTNV